jgi:hypothetical protein
MTESVAAAPRSSRRSRRPFLWVILVAVIFAPPLAYYFYRSHRAAAELKEAVAETDRLDPGWRLEELEAKRKVIPKRRNAGRVVLAAHQKLPQKWGTSAVFLEIGDLPTEPPLLLSGRQTIALRAELTKLAPALLQARGLKDLPEGRYEIQWSEDGFGTLFPHWQPAREIASLLSFDALLRARDGDADGALDSCLAVLNAGRSIGDEPTLVSLLVRIACQALAVQRLEQALAQGLPSGEALARVQAALEKEARPPLLLIAFRGERAALHRFMTQVEEGKASAEQPGARPQEISFREKVEHLLAFNSAPLAHAWMLHYLNQAIEIAKRPPEEQQTALQELEGTLQEAPKVAKMVLPAIVKVREAYVRNLAQMRCAAVALAAERYRRQNDRWPAKLADLVRSRLLRKVPADPYDGRPLRYRKLKNGVVVYSVGPDGRDDGGKIDRKNPVAKGTDQGFQLWDVGNRRQPPPPAPKKQVPDGRPGPGVPVHPGKPKD